MAEVVGSGAASPRCAMAAEARASKPSVSVTKNRECCCAEAQWPCSREGRGDKGGYWQISHLHSYSIHGYKAIMACMWPAVGSCHGPGKNHGGLSRGPSLARVAPTWCRPATGSCCGSGKCGSGSHGFVLWGR